MDSILIMGGTVLLSRCVAQLLAADGYRVDILTRGKRPVGYQGIRQHLICDRRDPDSLKQKLSGMQYDYVFDICGFSASDIHLLLDALDPSALKKYLYCSSASVYQPASGPISEDGERVADDCGERFAVNKKQAEDAVINSGLAYTILRPAYIYGEYGIIPRETYIFDCVKNGRKMVCCQPGDRRAQFVYVKELAAIFKSAMLSEHAVGCYNACAEKPVSLAEVARVCGAAAGGKCAVEFGTDSTGEEACVFPYMDEGILIDCGKLAHDGLYTPKLSFEDGIRKVYGWYAGRA